MVVVAEEDAVSLALFWSSWLWFGELISTGEENATLFLDGVSGRPPGDVIFELSFVDASVEGGGDDDLGALVAAGMGAGEGARPRPPSMACERDAARDADTSASSRIRASASADDFPGEVGDAGPVEELLPLLALLLIALLVFPPPSPLPLLWSPLFPSEVIEPALLLSRC